MMFHVVSMADRKSSKLVRRRSDPAGGAAGGPWAVPDPDPDGGWQLVQRLPGLAATGAAAAVRELARSAADVAGVLAPTHVSEEGTDVVVVSRCPGDARPEPDPPGRPPRAPEAARVLAVTAGRALAELHRRGVVHGSVTRRNVLFDGAGRPLLVEVGIAPLWWGRASPLSAAPRLGGRRPRFSPERDVSDLVELCLDVLGPEADRGLRRRLVAARRDARRTSGGAAPDAAATAFLRRLGVETGPCPGPPPPTHPRRRRGRARTVARERARRVALTAAAVTVTVAGFALGPGLADGTGTVHPPAPGAGAPHRPAPRPCAGPRPATPVGGGAGEVVWAAWAGDGCEYPLTWRAGSLEAVGPAGRTVRFALGGPGDVFLTGDWFCRGRALPGLYRPAEGEVYLFPGWPTGARVLRSRVTFRVARGGTAGVIRGADGCDDIRVAGRGSRTAGTA